jgi:myosin heavy subunit
MLDQLRYAGLVEVCRIRKLGYPVRRAFDEFYKRYKCCDLSLRSSNMDVDALLSSLKLAGVLIDGEWAKGKSKVFMRTSQNEKLELAREAAFTKVVVVVQACARGYINRMKLKRYKELIAIVKQCIQKREEGPLIVAIDSAFELPWGGGHLQVIKDAKALLIRVRDENRVIKLLENAFASSELNSLKSALSAAKSLSPPFEHPLMVQVAALVEKLETVVKVKSLLTAAIENRSLPDLTSSILQAQEIQLSCAELNQALTLKTRIEQEEALLAKVAQAKQARDLNQLNTYLAECVSFGIEEHPEVKAANKVRNEIVAEIERAAAEAERARAEQLRKEEEERQERIRLEIQAKKDALNSNLVKAIDSRYDYLYHYYYYYLYIIIIIIIIIVIVFIIIIIIIIITATTIGILKL